MCVSISVIIIEWKEKNSVAITSSSYLLCDNGSHLINRLLLLFHVMMNLVSLCWWVSCRKRNKPITSRLLSLRPFSLSVASTC
mmetsp:Transcript_48077/g.53579  ORF Transcript_48077/g.53579 Transcript_48077/m.53579 type:complete len:83 (-) Transcript_48077:372-620(-)